MPSRLAGGDARFLLRRAIVARRAAGTGFMTWSNAPVLEHGDGVLSQLGA
jgi:hypothetical protein